MAKAPIVKKVIAPKTIKPCGKKPPEKEIVEDEPESEEKIIPLFDGYGVSGNAYTWVLYVKSISGEKAKESGVESWKPAGYYPKLSSVMNAIPEIELKKCDTLPKLVKRLNELEKAINDALKLRFQGEFVAESAEDDY